MQVKQDKRPLNFFVFSWTLGLIGGTLYVNDIQSGPLFCAVISILLVGCYYYFGKKRLMLFVIGFLLGMAMLVLHPTTRNLGKLKVDEKITLEGKVEEIQKTEYGQNLILRDIVLQHMALQGKVQVQVSLSQNIFEGERLQVIGGVKAFPVPMNPSDFDYGQYLKGKNVVGVIKAKSCESLGGKPNVLIQLRIYLVGCLEDIFKGQDEGIMQAALLGDDAALVDETQSLYSAVGIGHILCVSGFHVALIVGFLLGFSAYVGIPYTKRYVFVISGIWLYTLLTGMATSTVRASVMATLVMLSRILWEEEDFWISIGLSAFLILLWRPYSIFSMGFQLSFGAVIAIGISQIYLKRWEKEWIGLKKKFLKVVIPWITISLLTSPIIAFYYYEIPFLSSVLNLIILPLFSLIIVLGWCILGIHLIGIPVFGVLAKGIIVLLQAVHMLCNVAVKLPIGTLCTGRPSFIALIMYYVVLILIGLWLYGIRLPKKVYTISMLGVGMWLGNSFFLPQLLQITYLYVGQGDGSVIKTPHQKLIVIDGGPPGKGAVVERYIKYSGKKEVEALMVSHSDSDHISGIIELVQGDLKINHVIISKTDESELLDTLITECARENIQVITLGAADCFQVDTVDFRILAPKVKQSDANNNSLVCLTTYKNFKALFTGDKEKESESSIYEGIAPISLLKVSHHGSRTGTEEKLLLKLRPQYAMISCGINNLYGHPHKDVLDALNTCQVPYKRTDLQGAIWARTDGEKMTLYTQREADGEEE